MHTQTELITVSKRKSRTWNREARIGAAYLSPAALFLVVLLGIPIVTVIGYSLFDNVIVKAEPVFVGLGNYVKLLTDPVYHSALANTFVFAVFSVFMHIVLGFVFAVALNNNLLPRWAQGLYRGIYILPWVFTASIVVIIWQLMLNPNGIINYILSSIGLTDGQTVWLADPGLAMMTVIFINIWAGYPFFMVSILAGLQSVPAELYEAAKVDGANAVQRFRHITVPSVGPLVMSMTLLDLLWTMHHFSIVWLATGGGPLGSTELIGTYTYKLAFSRTEFAQSAASGFLLFAISMVVAVFYVKHQSRRANDA